MQELLTRLLIVAAKSTPDSHSNDEGTRMTMLINEHEMVRHIYGVAREVAVRIGAISRDNLDLMAHDEVLAAIEAQHAGTYVAMMQHLNAYRAWWENHRWLNAQNIRGPLIGDNLQKHLRAKDERDRTRLLLLRCVEESERIG